MESSEIHQRTILDFLTLAGEYCKVCNNIYELSPKELGALLLKILPMLYIKAQSLPDYSDYDPESVEKFVSEEEWRKIQFHASIVLGKYDQYHETQGRFNQPEQQTISENIADIYQDMQDFVQLFALGINDATYEAVGEVKRSFREYWGKSLVNTLKIVHYLYYQNLLSDKPLLNKPEAHQSETYDEFPNY